jgi:hypothetical protein
VPLRYAISPFPEGKRRGKGNKMMLPSWSSTKETRNCSALFQRIDATGDVSVRYYLTALSRK